MIDRLTHMGETWENVEVALAQYGNGDLAMRLVVEEAWGREVLAMVSVNLETYGLRPGPGCVFVKDYSEGEGLLEALVEAGALEPTGKQVTFGPHGATAREAKVLLPASEEESR